MNNMKNINRFLSAALVTIGLSSLCISCADEHEFFPQMQVAEGTNVKFVHAASDAKGVNFYVNSAVVPPSTAPNYNAYLSTFPVTNYAVLGAGSLAVKVAVPATDVIPESVLGNVSVTANNNENRTIALVGVSPSYEVISIDDNLSTAPLDGKAYVRLVNFIHNSTNSIYLEVTDGNNVTTTYFKNTPYKSASAFVGLPFGSYTNIRIKDGVTNAVIATSANTVWALTANKVYTYYATGQIGQTSTALRPTLSRMINR